VPIDHVKLPVRDLAASKRFYLQALAPLGFKLVYEGESSLGFGRGDGGEDDEPFAVEVEPRVEPGTHIAFTASGPEEVQAFHAAALAGGGRDNGPPGGRPYGGSYFAAYVLDPDGHNIEAVYHGPEQRR
jgi:catechol 2,3-dioxygenase-like lactoylglutathione lyase family enzyme